MAREILFVFIILGNLSFLVSSRFTVCIRIVAIQGVLTGLLPLVINQVTITFAVGAFTAAVCILKGIVFPFLLTRALARSGARRYVELYLNYPISVAVGVVLVMVSMYIGTRLVLPHQPAMPLLVPAAVCTILTGLFVLVSRVKAIAQVLGYLILENGIYAFGAALFVEQPFMVEWGILLDVFAAVFVMGIAIFHISREFDHIDTQHMNALSDWPNTPDISSNTVKAE